MPGRDDSIACRIFGANQAKIFFHRDSQCPTSTITLWRMIINYINNKARILNRFGNGWLIKRAKLSRSIGD
jgi:hypothetical protein